MSLRFICIEVRKNLLCANVFLQFDQSLTETEFLRINVDADTLRLREYSTETRASLAEHFAIEARTMSNLTVEECNASFRLTISDIKEDIVPSTNTTVTLEPQVIEGSTVAVKCRNCLCSLIAAQEFRKVREFPSGSIDVSEFFCHHGPDFGEVLLPQALDFFYGFQFVVLRQDLLRETTKEKEGHIYCRRCLQYLGETLFSGKAAKMWADTLRLAHSNDGDTNKESDVFKSSIVVTSTCHLMQKIIADTSTSTSTESFQQCMHFSKVLLEAVFPNRQRKYLMLHILEKQLPVLRNEQPLAHGSHNNNNVLQVQLKRYKCCKLLYRFFDNETELEECTPAETDAAKRENEISNRSGATLLAAWQRDILIHTLKISYSMLGALIAELDENSLLLPELYRYAADEFQLSYVFSDT